MVNKFSDVIYSDILQHTLFRSLFEELLSQYLMKLFGSLPEKHERYYNTLLRYADILSLSADEEHQNLAQQIVIILSQLYPNEDIIKLFKEKIYKNVSNFVSVSLSQNTNVIRERSSAFLEDLVYHTHKIRNKTPNSNHFFFDSQLTLLNSFKNNQYYSFSAPTSMGKTFVITQFILNKLQQNSNDNFVILVPTRALISEIANKLIVEFKNFIGHNKHRVVTTLSSNVGNEKFIAVVTPERLYYSMLSNKNLSFRYLFIDEAHKISSRDQRSTIYYKILDMLKSNNSVCIYFSSPVIPNPDIYLQLTASSKNKSSCGYVFTFSPVIQNKIYINALDKYISIYNPLSNQFLKGSVWADKFSNVYEILLHFGKDKCNLIYVSSVHKAISQALKLKNFLKQKNQINLLNQSQEALEKVAQNIENKIHKDYYLATLIRYGIAYHIGSLPSEIRAQIENLLRSGYIKYCFCTSTLLEGVNVPIDNLFIFDYKKGRSKLSNIDAFNLIGRAGRVSLNEFGNVFIVIEDDITQRYFNDVLLKELPLQTLLPHKAISTNIKKDIVKCLREGETNLIEQMRRSNKKQLTQLEYEYATKCLNMLLYDICTGNKSYIVKNFEEEKALSPQDIIDIRDIFKNHSQEDEDINISIKQKESLYDAIKRTKIHYPDNFDYDQCVAFLNNLSDIFQWPMYEKWTLGKGQGKCLNYYAVILLQWMQGKGLHEIIRRTLDYHLEHRCFVRNWEMPQPVEFNGSIEHKNIVINEILNDVENIINYKLSIYFLKFTETYLKCHSLQSIQNDWYEYVEHGTCNKLVIKLQKIGFLREESLVLSKPKFARYISIKDEKIYINPQILQEADHDLELSINRVKINYPEIFVN